ncbi:DNA-binding GntR family transcriptional regulator [Streptomyces griseochromogenes]|uniref:DNA-binding GntR family transcriptional regulator n=1 Tax=Streptomyces griseochromogenes TaxID=68214 RepID=A0ABS4M6B9_9ACTN|nr:GntR family transcriptional regulator [Streptomyces griseochromogenes]MBP2055210.1 DNA-binding GntR family transcriptional regulator [Streptomyces griseochromogenes]
MALKRTSLPRTAEAVALAELRDAIVRGDLPPGAPIRQSAAAEELGLSVIPVREALKTLAGEGIVTYVPQRGYTVTELSPQSVDGIFRIRELLEGEAEANAAARMRPEDIAAMRTALEAQRAAVAGVDVPGTISANRIFHFALLDRCDNEWMLRFIRQLWEALEPHRALAYRRAAAAGDAVRAEAILGEHEGIVAAFEQGDFPLALRLLAEHRTGGRADFHRLLVVDAAPV